MLTSEQVRKEKIPLSGANVVKLEALFNQYNTSGKLIDLLVLLHFIYKKRYHVNSYSIAKFAENAQELFIGHTFYYKNRQLFIDDVHVANVNVPIYETHPTDFWKSYNLESFLKCAFKFSDAIRKLELTPV